MRKAIFVIVLILLPFLSAQGAPSSPLITGEEWVIPLKEWTSETRLWLNRAMPAEIGWAINPSREKQQIAIAWVLAKRYHTKYKPLRARGKKITFLWVIRNYCNGMQPNKRHLTKRQKWLRAMPLTGEKPKHWPKGLNWDTHAVYLKRGVKLMDEWVRGKHPDPCPQAIHWGAVSDPKQSVKQIELKGPGCRFKPSKKGRRTVLYKLRR